MLWRLSLGIAGSQAEGEEEPAEVVQALEVVRVLAGSLHPALHPALQQLLPALPFVLRRVKEEVLADLPPKITQDYYCHLSPLQTQLYEDFTRA